MHRLTMSLIDPASPSETGRTEKPSGTDPTVISFLMRMSLPRSRAVRLSVVDETAVHATGCGAKGLAPHPSDTKAGNVKTIASIALATMAFASTFVGTPRIATAQPSPVVLIVLENLHWTDPSSLELLHFIARQLGSARITILCTYSSADRENNHVLRATERSLVDVGLATTQQLAGLPAAVDGQRLDSPQPLEQPSRVVHSPTLRGKV